MTASLTNSTYLEAFATSWEIAPPITITMVSMLVTFAKTIVQPVYRRRCAPPATTIWS